MNERGNIILHIQSLIELFVPKCLDLSTIEILKSYLNDKNKWSKAHNLFSTIRQKNLEAIKNKKEILAVQYDFEEICAKTLYNLSYQSAPFDADSPYWIVPKAIRLARKIGIEETKIVNIISS